MARTGGNQLSHRGGDSNKSCNGQSGSYGEVHSIHHHAGMEVFITGTLKTSDWLGSKLEQRPTKIQFRGFYFWS